WSILKNAMKFTPAGGEIIVLTTNPGTGEIRLEFTDTGIGIESQFLGLVFDTCMQADAIPRSASNGLGLGMSISKTIVEQHGGTINVASAGADRGATFTVDLATVVADSAEDVSRPAVQSDPHHIYRLLLVED